MLIADLNPGTTYVGLSHHDARTGKVDEGPWCLLFLHGGCAFYVSTRAHGDNFVRALKVKAFADSVQEAGAAQQWRPNEETSAAMMREQQEVENVKRGG